MAKARDEEMSQHHSLVDADAREEDHAIAQANLQLARAQLDNARAVLEQTYIRSPIDATVLLPFSSENRRERAVPTVAAVAVTSGVVPSKEME